MCRMAYLAQHLLADAGDGLMLKLLVLVGTQDTSPLICSILAGALKSSETMIQDILTSRATFACCFRSLLSHVETLGLGHLHLEVTVPRVVVLRDAIMDLFAVELGCRFVPAAGVGCSACCTSSVPWTPPR